MKTSPTPRLRAGRALRWVGGSLVAFEVLYLVVANFLLASSWGQAQINRRPEKLSARWESAWTLLPGLVHVDGLELVGRARRAGWRAELERGRLFIWLPSLAGRHLRLLGGSARGVDIDVETTPPLELPAGDNTRRGWRITLGGLALTQLETLRVNRYRLVGDGTVRGLARFEVRGPMLFDFEEFTLKTGQLMVDDHPVAESIELDASFDVDEITIAEATVADLLASLSGTFEIEAEASTLGFLGEYLGRFPWVGLGGAGHLALALELTDGWLAPGSELLFEGPSITASYLGLEARGEGSVRGLVPTEEHHVRLEATLDSFHVDRPADGSRLLEGKGLSVVVINDSTAIDRPAEGLAVAMELPPSRIPDLAVLGPWIPESSGMTLSGGAGEISAYIRYATEQGGGDGWLTVAGRRVNADYRGKELLADVTLEARFPRVELDAGTLALDGTSLRVHQVDQVNQVGQADPWHGSILVPSGTLTRPFGAAAGTPAVVRGRLEAGFRDTSPLTALIQDRVPKLGWFDRLLTVQDVELEARFHLEGPLMRFEQLEVTGGAQDRLEIQAELDLLGKEIDGVMLAAWGPLTAAVELDDQDRDWKLTRSRQWYERKATQYRAARKP